MTETIKKEPICSHLEQTTNPEGFKVCSSCGEVLEEYGNLEQGYMFQNHTFFGSTCKLNTTQIGKTLERIRNKFPPNLIYLNKSYSFPETIKFKILTETKKLISVLDLPSNLENEIIDTTYSYYLQFRKSDIRKNRNYRNLTAITLFLVCIKRNIHITKTRLLEYSNLNIHTFNRYFYAILQNNKDLLEKLRLGVFRKNLILNAISGFVSQNNFPAGFLEYYKRILDLYWNHVKNHPNKTITALIFNFTRKIFIHNLGYKKSVNLWYFSNRGICRFLGITEAVSLHAENNLIGLLIKNTLEKKGG